MARSIEFSPPKRDARVELQHRLERAPAEHAAALLDAYELLQLLHDRRVLDTLRGLIGSGEEVLDIAVQGASSESATHALRNLLVVYNVLGQIDPEKLKLLTEPVPRAVQASVVPSEAPGLWRLLKGSIFDQDFRLGLAAACAVLRTVGRQLAANDKADSKGSDQ